MIGLLYQLCVVAYIMEKTSVSQRIRRYVYVISTRLHDLNSRLYHALQESLKHENTEANLHVFLNAKGSAQRVLRKREIDNDQHEPAVRRAVYVRDVFPRASGADYPGSVGQL